MRLRRRDALRLSPQDEELLERVCALQGLALARLAAVNGASDDEARAVRGGRERLVRIVRRAAAGPRDGREMMVREWRHRAAFALTRAAHAGIGDLTLDEALELRTRIHAEERRRRSST